VELTPVQQRVVGALVEKELTTPDNYPLSMNALLAACNQSSNRDPVVHFDEKTVGNALLNLKAEGVTRVVYSKGMRVDKYRHVLHEALEVSRPELSLLAVLMLRGPQTVAELRTRTERMHPFEGVHDVESTLASLAGRVPAHVALLPRQPGHKEPRWSHLLGPSAPASDPEEPFRGIEREENSAPASTEREAPAPAPDRIAQLEARIASVEARLSQLEELEGR
jgi:uncharacterized protein YceH (UPF0502 family)